MNLNVYTEWGKLKEIVVGNCFNITDVNVDTSFKLFFLKNIDSEFIHKSIKLQAHMVQQRQVDLDNLASVLEQEGITVFRPRRLEFVKKFTTPNFEDFLCPVDNPRDQNLIVGDEIIETSCQWRRRYFENDLMKDIFKMYFKRGARWTCSPRPEMTDNNFDFENMPWEEDERLRGYRNNPDDFEIMFDGAQCLKFGKDIVMNISTKNHYLGYEWLKRHLRGRVNVHSCEITDHHIDGMFMPLKPGLLLFNPTNMEKMKDLLPEKLRKWDYIKVPLIHEECENPLHFASHNINVNVLPLSEKKVIVFSQDGHVDNRFLDLLNNQGITPIPIRLRHSRMFGGGVHCVTLDTVREDNLENYF